MLALVMLSPKGGKLWPAPDDAPDHTPLVGLPWGEQQFWGVPFSLAAAGAERAVVLVAQEVSASVEIPVNATARRILYAHTCAPVPGEWATVEGTGEEGWDLSRPLCRRQFGRAAAAPPL